MIAEIECNSHIDGEPLYQGQWIKYNGRGKHYIAYHNVFLIESIIKCYEDHYWPDDNNENVADGTTNGHCVFHACVVINRIVWPRLPNNDDEMRRI